MTPSIDLIANVARAGLRTHSAFSRSLDYWHDPSQSSLDWTKAPADVSSVKVSEGEALIVQGKDQQPTINTNGGTVHICEHLRSELTLAGQTETIIFGNVEASSTIVSSGIASLFIAGDFCGHIVSTGMIRVWVGGTFSGTLKTGMPMTMLWIEQDFTGSVQANDVAGLLTISVEGFAHADVLNNIVDSRYTQFHAVIGKSSVMKGIYPSKELLKKISLEKKNSFNRWCVCS